MEGRLAIIIPKYGNIAEKEKYSMRKRQRIGDGGSPVQTMRGNAPWRCNLKIPPLGLRRELPGLPVIAE